MSTKALFTALKSHPKNPYQKLILILIADISNDKDQCWPSHHYLSEMSGCSRSSVIRHVKALEDKGFLSVTHRLDDKGKKTSNVYTVLHEQKPQNDSVTQTHQEDGNRGGYVSERPVHSVTEEHRDSVTVTHNTPILSILPIDTPIVHTCSFDEFYAAYPKKVGKPDALRAWNKLSPNPLLVTRILTDIRDRIEQGAWCTGPGKQFIPGPAPYLNGKKWEDEIIPRPELTPKRDPNGYDYDETQRMIEQLFPEDYPQDNPQTTTGEAPKLWRH